MPDVSGLDVVRVLRANPATKDCVILMRTMHGSPEDNVDALGLGADDRILQPFSHATRWAGSAPPSAGGMSCAKRLGDGGLELAS